MSVYLHVPPPDGPLLHDVATPYCRRSGTARCEERCRLRSEELHAELSAQIPDSPAHVMT